jgi:iron(II)-dependent oxidoreductase
MEHKKGVSYTFVLFSFLFVFQQALAAVPKENMVLVPEGPFLMGSRQADGRIQFEIGVDELPQQEVTLPAFYIDRFEVTVAQYKKFLDVTGRKPPGDPKFPEIYPWNRGEDPPAEITNHPVIYVTWYDADDYCRWTGKRLPAEAEWEKAARGTDGRYWPWGNVFDSQKANVREYNARGTLPVGSFPKGASPYGVYDMAGNVAEWVADWYEAYPGSTLVRAAFGKVNKVIRGGAWVLEGDPYSRVTHRTRSRDPDSQHRSVGFRCAKDVK